MNTTWKIKIHRLVLSEDFKSISYPDQRVILKDIGKKLSLEPKSYGKPLSGELKGYWRLKVKDYRVIYKIKEDTIEVLVIKVGIRRDEEVYKKLLYRLKKLGID
ncbi:MAG: type II toxin-antitoxin system RelE/ParE family toxin [bacterium]